MTQSIGRKPPIKEGNKLYIFFASTPMGSDLYLTDKSIETLKNYQITIEEIHDYFGEDDADTVKERLLETLSTPDGEALLRYDILSYAEVLEAPLYK